MALILLLSLALVVVVLSGGRTRGVGLGLGVFGAFAVLYWSLSGDLGPHGPQILDFDRWLALGAGSGGMVAIVWGFAAWRSPSGAGAGLIIVAVFGALLGGLWVVDTLNRQWDEAEPQQRSMTVHQVHRFDQRRADPHFMVDLVAPDGEILRVRIPREQAERLAPGDRRVLSVHPGAFGVRWVPADD